AEGTSSNGESVLPFKNAFFQAAINAEVVLVPVCINYLTINNSPVTSANRDKVFYYGDMGFTKHLGRLLSAQSIEVECRFLESIPLVKTDDRKETAKRVHQRITDHYVPIR